MDEESYEAIVALLYEAALEPERWKTALLALSETVGGILGQVVIWDRLTLLPSFASISDEHQETANKLYAEYYAAIDPRTAKVRELSPGSWMNDAKHFDEVFVQHNEIYQDFLIPFDYRWVIGTRFELTNNTEAIYAFLRTPSQKAFSAKDERFLHRLNPHLQRAVQIHERLFQAEAKAAVGASALHSIKNSMLITDHLGRILFCNRAAETLLLSENAIGVSRGFLSAQSVSDQHVLDHLLDAAVTRRQGGGMRLRHGDGGDLFLVVIPLAPDLGTGNPWERPLAMVLVADGRNQRKPTHDDAILLRQVFALTPAEARAALALCDGGSIEETAATLGIRPNTLKTQLSGIYQKTGIDSRAKLVKLVLTLAGVDSKQS